MHILNKPIFLVIHIATHFGASFWMKILHWTMFGSEMLRCWSNEYPAQVDFVGVEPGPSFLWNQPVVPRYT